MFSIIYNIDVLERITLNLVSFSWITIHWLSHGFGISSAQDIITALVGLSIVFFNVARGIKALRKRNPPTPSTYDKASVDNKLR